MDRDMHRAIWASSLLLLLGAAAPVRAEALAPQTAEGIARCERCHGAGADSPATFIPRLNGQQADYIVKRLKDFTQPVPQGPHAIETMSAAAPEAPEASRAAIAAYFARQKPMTAAPGRLARQGRQIYEQGIDAQNVVACSRCHGADARGHDAIPGLMGQHADYLKTQLWLFHFPLRASRLMHENTEYLTADQVDALVSFLAGK